MHREQPVTTGRALLGRWPSTRRWAYSPLLPIAMTTSRLWRHDEHIIERQGSAAQEAANRRRATASRRRRGGDEPSPLRFVGPGSLGDAFAGRHLAARGDDVT